MLPTISCIPKEDLEKLEAIEARAKAALLDAEQQEAVALRCAHEEDCEVCAEAANMQAQLKRQAAEILGLEPEGADETAKEGQR